MCCQPAFSPRRQEWAMRTGSCDCGCIPFFRRFYSSKEELEGLEDYRDQLKKELAGVDERIRENKGK